MIETIDLGLVQAIHVGLTSPSNTKMIWYDTNVGENIQKYYDVIAAEWVVIGTAGITSINALTTTSQLFATSESGTNFTISSVTATHTFNLPVASATKTGKLSSADWSTFNAKEPAITNLSVTKGGTGTTTTFTQGSVIFTGASGVYSQDNPNFFYDDTQNFLGLGLNTGLGAKLDIKAAGSTSATFSVRIRDSVESPVFYISDNGFVGVRTSTATAFAERFRVSGAMYINDAIYMNGYGFFSYGGAGQLALNTSDNRNLLVTLHGTGEFQIWGNSLQRLGMNSSGQFGINNSVPSASLDIEGYGSTSATYSLKIRNDASDIIIYLRDDRNFAFLSESYGSGVGVMSIGNSLTPPSTNPTGGGVLYAEGGALKWRGSSGTVTPIAIA